MPDKWSRRGSIYIRDRRPPPPTAGLSIKGWLQWEVFDLDLGRVVRGGEQSNLVLDQGLEQMASYGFLGLQAYAAVGTGSTAPAVTDTALVSEIARTNSNGGIGDSLVKTADGVYQKTVAREFTEAQVGGQNCTEWAFAPVASSPGNIAVRELFRDGSNNPITITPTASQRLRLYYTQEYQLTPVVATAVSFSITNDASSPRSGQFLFQRVSSDNEDLSTANGLMKAADPWSPTLYKGWLTGTTNPPVLTYNGSASPNSFSLSRTFNAYTALSFARSMKFFLDTNDGNGDIKFFAWGQNQFSSCRPGMIFGFDSGQEFTKDNLHQLTIDPLFTLTWDRA